MAFEDSDKEKTAYAVESVSDDSFPSYEEAAVTSGAPTEKISPLGYHVDWVSVIFLVRTTCPSSLFATRFTRI